ncbi:hypothetical protein K501DRAFT_284130 [Backusella circina FSU 941]|nr:hypothetical protein K501DRAFT_284130 [Backusella circina FSU 941]
MEWIQAEHSTVADFYKNGVEINSDEKVKWYKKAYLAGCSDASIQVARYYDHIDKTEAFKWWYGSSTVNKHSIAK